MGTSPARGRQVPARLRLFQFVLLIVVSILSFGALVLPELLLPAVVPLTPGDVSPSDFQAPETRTFVSLVRTEEEQRKAENAVPPVYGTPDPSIARRQIDDCAPRCCISLLSVPTQIPPSNKTYW